MIRVFTIFEGDYHLGVGALANSLHAAGFRGELVLATPGPRPPWMPADVFEPSPGFRLRHHPIERPPGRHPCMLKPTLGLEFLGQDPVPDAVAYFDPDIVVKAPWRRIRDWIGSGFAVCQDQAWMRDRTHPVRRAWVDYLRDWDCPAARDLDHYYNAGFYGAGAGTSTVLRRWGDLIERAGADGIELDEIKRWSEHRPYLHIVDQDLLNFALMAGHEEIRAGSPADMDFHVEGDVLSHAIGPVKPWRKRFLADGIRGRPLLPAERHFWRHVEAPIRLFPVARVRRQRAVLRVADLLSRVVRQS